MLAELKKNPKLGIICGKMGVNHSNHPAQRWNIGGGYVLRRVKEIIARNLIPNIIGDDIYLGALLKAIGYETGVLENVLVHDVKQTKLDFNQTIKRVARWFLMWEQLDNGEVTNGMESWRLKSEPEWLEDFMYLIRLMDTTNYQEMVALQLFDIELAKLRSALEEKPKMCTWPV